MSPICFEQGVAVVTDWENNYLIEMMVSFPSLLHHTHPHRPACGDGALALCVKNHKHTFYK
jgi:hypothetical protein